MLIFDKVVNYRAFKIIDSFEEIQNIANEVEICLELKKENLPFMINLAQKIKAQEIDFSIFVNVNDDLKFSQMLGAMLSFAQIGAKYFILHIHDLRAKADAFKLQHAINYYLLDMKLLVVCENAHQIGDFFIPSDLDKNAIGIDGIIVRDLIEGIK